jgi:hypothetical protein
MPQHLETEREREKKRGNKQTNKKLWRDSLPIDMLLSAVSVLFVAQLSSEVPEGLTNNPALSSQSSVFLTYITPSLLHFNLQASSHFLYTSDCSQYNPF